MDLVMVLWKVLSSANCAHRVRGDVLAHELYVEQEQIDLASI